MEVRFATVQLRRCYQQEKTRTKAWGAKVARIYVRRVEQLHAARDVQDLRASRALHVHALSGGRKGQHALKLDGFYRLIVTFEGKAMTIVKVEEVSKHYDD